MLILLITVAFIFSAFFSFSETVFTVVDRLMIRVWSKTGLNSAVRTKKLIKNPDNFLIPILVGNNIANVAYATFFTYLFADMKWKFSHFQSTIFITIILVIFAEILPKIFGKKYANKLSLKLIYPFFVIKIILSPISFIVGKISRRIMKSMKIPLNKSNWILISKSDIDLIVKEAVKAEAVNKKDAEIIKRILNLEQKKIKEIMLHRKSIIAVDINSPIYKLKKMVMLTSFSKIIIYENDLDNIKGVVFVNDLLKETKEITDIVRPVIFVRESSSVLTVFKILKKEKATICIAIDEFGGCVGLVTMHDILELIVGRVDDPHDSLLSDMGIIYRREQKILILNGSADLEELDKMIGSIIGKEKRIFGDRNETINGFIINHLKRIPEQGEILEIENLVFKIVKAKRNYIETIIIQLP
ncbi:MAG: hemolysin family protein [Candidatus Delongbacteria bacterium]|nr:hemolysin family protein [Candidatus Delongbacteria bacterium]MCG2760622.1 hemolysin family protein [Candidatus Delongbacteria bacterium]